MNKQIYQIDQSGKIEQTNKPTVITLANGNAKTVKITAVEKRKLLKAVKEISHPKQNYIYRLFAVLIFILTGQQKLLQLEIDREYPRHESVIKDTLIYLYQKNRIALPDIEFILVGKKSKCHRTALAVFQQSAKADFIVKAEEVIKILYEKGVNKKGWRSSSKNDNP